MKKKLQQIAVNHKRKTNPIRFASGLFALTLLGQVYHAFNYEYFISSGMIDVFLASVCKVIFVIVDSVNDILFGMLSEKTRSRWGKRIPWLVGGTPFFIFFVIFCYFPNNSFGWTRGGYFFYYLFFSLMIENCSTVLYINYNAIFPVTFRDEGERTKTSSFKHVFELAAMGICYVGTPFLIQAGWSYMHVGLLYGLVFLMVMVFCISGIHVDKKQENIDIKTNVRYSLKNTIKDVIHNKPFVIYNVTQSFFNAVLGVLVSIYPRYCIYVLNAEPVHQGALMGALFGSLLLSIPVWNVIVRKYGFRRAYKISYTFLPFALFALTFPTSWWQALIILIFAGPMIGGLLITPDLMSTELIDIDKMKNGISREASFASLGSLINRISLIFSAMVMPILSIAFGFKSGTEPGPNPGLAFRILTGVFLGVLAAIGTLFCYYYIKISKKDSEALKERNKTLKIEEEKEEKEKKEHD